MTITSEDAFRSAMMARIIAIESVLVAEGKTTNNELKEKAKAQIKNTIINEEDKEKILKYL